ncbi:MAG: addiction module protein [Planctomycetes bacterium]|nr:addiction module protein [Planctomycetota bacterium]
MTTFDDILSAARALSPGERLRLVDTIWEEVSPTDWQLPSTEWLTEAQRRSAEFDAGRMTASSWPEVQARARRRAGLDG